MTSVAVGASRPVRVPFMTRAASRRSSPSTELEMEERASRKICVEMARSPRPAKRRALAPKSRSGAPFTVSKAIGIGRRVREAQRSTRPVTAILDEAQGNSCSWQGRRCRPADDRGFLRGPRRDRRLDDDRGSRLEIAFQNEWSSRGATASPWRCRPIWICVVDTVSGNAAAPRRSAMACGDGRGLAGAAGFPDPEGS